MSCTHRQSVYPRVCGGTATTTDRAASAAGLSPRVRGNRAAGRRQPPRNRSIPACAGEPWRHSIGSRPARVYPRVCGGTVGSNAASSSSPGLSPRVRGNLSSETQIAASLGSIPACAGEPSRRFPRIGNTRVYPRVCGGTCELRASSLTKVGLSPRVRGNHKYLTHYRLYHWSIPACAGEPGLLDFRASGHTVYPRVCGGTMASSNASVADSGLSPRVRGNLNLLCHIKPPVRSIPACAGEPLCLAWVVRLFEVYPRVCGGTSSTSSIRRGPHGLSPRVRGNQGAAVLEERDPRSIPACAGEPPAARTTLPQKTVYPRVCGGTDTPATR